MNAETAIDDATETYGVETMNAPASQLVELKPGQVPLSIQPPPAPITPMQMIQEAAARGNMDVVAKLMDLQERWEKNNARKAFDAAMAGARAEIKPIVKNRAVDFTSQKGRTNYRYEDFAGVAAQVDPILANHGLSYRFRTQCDKDAISVTCIVAHKDGHSEENTLLAPNDHTGNKNAIQAIGSTQTYLQRYTLKAALGLAATNDDDAQAATKDVPAADTGELVSITQIGQIANALTVRGVPVDRFLKWARVEQVSDLRADVFKSCMDAIQNFKGAK